MYNAQSKPNFGKMCRSYERVEQQGNGKLKMETQFYYNAKFSRIKFG